MGKKKQPQAAAVKTLGQVAYEAFFKDDGTARPWGAVLRLPAEVADWERAAAAVINAAAARTPAQDAPDEPALAWRCFHCDEQFTDTDAARLHFGASEYDKPACQVDVVQLRWLEAQHRRACEEDTDLHRTIRGMACEHERLRKRAEEEGYAKGLADAARASQPTHAPTAAPTVPAGMVLMPLVPTSAMDDVMRQDDWCWADVLAAAEAVTEAQYEEAQAAPTAAGGQ